MGESVIPADLKRMKKNDIILIGVLAALSLAAYGIIALFSVNGTKDAEAVVLIDGEEYGRYPLNEDITKKIVSTDGDSDYNILEIRDGKAEITEATCPDKICVKHRPVDKQGESLVCLPNKVVVEIQSGEKSEVDATTR